LGAFAALVAVAGAVSLTGVAGTGVGAEAEEEVFLAILMLVYTNR
jgi:hypothetical protein